MAEDHLASIRRILCNHGVQDAQTAKQIWTALTELPEYDERVTGNERKELTRLRTTAFKFAGLLDGLSGTTFTYKNAQVVSDVIASVEDLTRRIDDRLREQGREARNPTSDTGQRRIKIYHLLRHAGVKTSRHQFASLIADLYIAAGAKKDKESLQATIDQQLRNLSI